LIKCLEDCFQVFEAFFYIVIKEHCGFFFSDTFVLKVSAYPLWLACLQGNGMVLSAGLRVLLIDLLFFYDSWVCYRTQIFSDDSVGGQALLIVVIGDAYLR